MATGTFERLKACEAPRRKRRSSSRMDKIPQWKSMMEYLGKHKIAPGEILQITVTPDDKAKYGIQSRRTVVRAVAGYIGERNLPYRLSSFTTDGTHYVQLQHTQKVRKSR